MERYIIALDMDGTLLNDKKEISFLTKNYLIKLSEAGHIVVISSGRPPRSILSYYNELKLDTPVICYNGAYIYKPHDNVFLDMNLMFKKDLTLEIYNKIKPYVTNVMFESLDNIYIDKYDESLDSFFWYRGMKLHTGDINDILNEDVYTFIGHYNGDGKELREVLNKAIENHPEIKLRFWTGAPYFELHFEMATKGVAIKEIAELYNIDKDHIISFGDAGNDIDLFKNSGHSVFMSNGEKSDLIKTKYVSVRDNNNDGIYYTLKEYFEDKLL